MQESILKQVEALRTAPTEQIREEYRSVFGEEPRTKNRVSLIRRLAWRLQALAEGGLSERARQRALEIAHEADLRVLAPRDVFEVSSGRFDRRIPTPGTVLSREFRGQTISVKVLPQGFEYQGRHYRSLSAIATEVTDTRWNGLAFFGLTGRKGARHGSTRR